MNRKTLNLAALIVFMGPVVANAAPILVSETLPDYSGPAETSGFPIDQGIIGTFTFASGDMLSATVSGTWGNASFPDSSAGADVYLDGLLVAQCIEFAACWLNATGTQTWSYTLSAADLDLGILDDGMADLRVVQTSSTTVRLGELRLEGELDTAQVPEPTSLTLLGLGLAGMGFTRRRRKI